MISEYKDMLEKARFYKKQVIQSFIKQGYFPSDEEIQTALSDIDSFLLPQIILAVSLSFAVKSLAISCFRTIGTSSSRCSALIEEV